MLLYSATSQLQRPALLSDVGLLQGGGHPLTEARTEEVDVDDIWDAELPRRPPEPTPTAMPGMFADEQYNKAQKQSLYVFKYLLPFVAALESFAHGANDTANATGACLSFCLPAQAFSPNLSRQCCRHGCACTGAADQIQIATPL
jgi:phosphate/sulfate permease